MDARRAPKHLHGSPRQQVLWLPVTMHPTRAARLRGTKNSPRNTLELGIMLGIEPRTLQAGYSCTQYGTGMHYGSRHRQPARVRAEGLRVHLPLPSAVRIHTGMNRLNFSHLIHTGTPSQYGYSCMYMYSEFSDSVSICSRESHSVCSPQSH